MFDGQKVRLAAIVGLGLLAGAASGRAQDGALGDPTRPTRLDEPPARNAQAAGPRWRLQSTLVAPGRRLAVINDTPLRPGDIVDGATLVDIRPDGVTLRVGERSLVFQLVPQIADIRGRDPIQETE